MTIALKPFDVPISSTRCRALLSGHCLCDIKSPVNVELGIIPGSKNHLQLRSTIDSGRSCVWGAGSHLEGAATVRLSSFELQPGPSLERFAKDGQTLLK